MKSQTFFWIFVRILIGLFFAYAGFSKLIEPYENFRGMINSYEVVPYALSAPIAQVLPWLEFIFGVFMLVGYLPKLASLVLAALSLAFLVVMGASNALLDSAAKDCGCFGQNALIHLTVWQVFILDFLFLLANLRFLALKEYPFSLHALFRRPR